jgi:hypothetical protein
MCFIQMYGRRYVCFIQKYGRRYVQNFMFQSLLYKLYAMLSIILTFHSINTDQRKLKNILYVWH